MGILDKFMDHLNYRSVSGSASKENQDSSFVPTLMSIIYFCRYIFIKANLTNILPLSSASMRIHPDPLGAIHKLRWQDFEDFYPLHLCWQVNLCSIVDIWLTPSSPLLVNIVYERPLKPLEVMIIVLLTAYGCRCIPPLNKP